VRDMIVSITSAQQTVKPECHAFDFPGYDHPQTKLKPQLTIHLSPFTIHLFFSRSSPRRISRLASFPRLAPQCSNGVD
jgi:hypothetical protein